MLHRIHSFTHFWQVAALPKNDCLAFRLQITSSPFHSSSHYRFGILHSIIPYRTRAMPPKREVPKVSIFDLFSCDVRGSRTLRTRKTTIKVRHLLRFCSTTCMFLQALCAFGRMFCGSLEEQGSLKPGHSSLYEFIVCLLLHIHYSCSHCQFRVNSTRRRSAWIYMHLFIMASFVFQFTFSFGSDLFRVRSLRRMRTVMRLGLGRPSVLE